MLHTYGTLTTCTPIMYLLLLQSFATLEMFLTLKDEQMKNVIKHISCAAHTLQLSIRNNLRNFAKGFVRNLC